DGTWPLTLETRDPDSLQVVETSAPFNVTIANPWAGPVGEQAGGLTIRISKWDMSNAADGHISLYEAFAIAGGTLGRAIEDHPTPDDTILRERDWIWGDGTGGADVRDSITIENSVNVSDPLILSTPLPRLGNGDSVLLRGVLDGSNLPEGAVGLDL